MTSNIWETNLKSKIIAKIILTIKTKIIKHLRQLNNYRIIF